MHVSYVCLLHLNSVRYLHVRGRYGGDTHMFHEVDVVLCGITAETAALSLSLVGHPWHIPILSDLGRKILSYTIPNLANRGLE